MKPGSYILDRVLINFIASHFPVSVLLLALVNKQLIKRGSCSVIKNLNTIKKESTSSSVNRALLFPICFSKIYMWKWQWLRLICQKGDGCEM